MSVLCVKVLFFLIFDYYKCVFCIWYIYLSCIVLLGIIIVLVKDYRVCYDYKFLNNVLNYCRK